ncbi:hypothetical protein B0H14DRAFT_2629300 [Mycena olivaceomarginata]|nr:hypothetical protein B0H14DRAFT_2629300 [Mycena olivaceomarginata]
MSTKETATQAREAKQGRRAKTPDVLDEIQHSIQLFRGVKTRKQLQHHVPRPIVQHIRQQRPLHHARQRHHLERMGAAQMVPLITEIGQMEARVQQHRGPHLETEGISQLCHRARQKTGNLQRALHLRLHLLDLRDGRHGGVVANLPPYLKNPEMRPSAVKLLNHERLKFVSERQSFLIRKSKLEKKELATDDEIRNKDAEIQVLHQRETELTQLNGSEVEGESGGAHVKSEECGEKACKVVEGMSGCAEEEGGHVEELAPRAWRWRCDWIPSPCHVFE